MGVRYTIIQCADGLIGPCNANLLSHRDLEGKTRLMCGAATSRSRLDRDGANGKVTEETKLMVSKGRN
jgi:hypothetical protein